MTLAFSGAFSGVYRVVKASRADFMYDSVFRLLKKIQIKEKKHFFFFYTHTNVTSREKLAGN